MPIEPFVLIVADHDNHTFSVEGPMMDDDPWSKPVVDAQQGGKRQINLFGARRSGANQCRDRRPQL